jgi:hypothetical protein
MELFSQRNLIKSKILHPHEMPDGLRNRIWNEIEESINSSRISNEKNNLIKKIWSEFFKKSNSELQGTISYK